MKTIKIELLKIISSIFLLLCSFSILAGTQTITISPTSPFDASSSINPTITFTTIHSFATSTSTTNDVNTIGFQLFYDSSVIQFATVTDLYDRDVSISPGDLVEPTSGSADRDSDSNTDRLINAVWVNTSAGSNDGDLTSLTLFTGTCLSADFQTNFGSVSGVTSAARLAACVALGGTQIAAAAGGEAVLISSPLNMYEIKFLWIGTTKSQTDINIIFTQGSTGRGFTNLVGVSTYTIQGPALPVSSTISTVVNSASITAGNQASFTINLLDNNGDQTSNFTTGSITLVSDLQANAGFVLTNNGTNVLVNATLTVAGSHGVGLYLDSILISGSSQTVVVSPDAINTATSTINPDTATTIIAGNSINFVIDVRDQFDNPVTISSSATTGNTLGGSLLSINSNTNIATITYTATQTGTESNLSVTINGTTFNLPAVSVNSGVITTTSTITPNTATTIMAGDSVSFIFDARDQFNNPVTISSSTTTGNTLGGSLLNINSNANIATITYTATQTGQDDNLSVTINSTIFDLPTVMVSVGVINATASIITLSSDNITADQSASLSIQFRDEFGNIATTSPSSVSLSVNGVASYASLTLSQNTGGIATFTYNLIAQGTGTDSGIVISLDSVQIGSAQAITTMSGASANIVVSANPSNIIANGASTQSVINVQLVDQFGNNRTGDTNTASFSSNGTGTTITLSTNSVNTVNSVASITIGSFALNAEGTVIVTANIGAFSESTTISVNSFGFTQSVINMIAGDIIALAPINATTLTVWNLVGVGTLFRNSDGATNSYTARAIGATITVSEISVTDFSSGAVSTLTITTYNPVTISVSSSIVRGDIATAIATGGDESYTFSSSNDTITASGGSIDTTNSSVGATTSITTTDDLVYSVTALGTTKSNSATSGQIDITTDVPNATTSTVSGSATNSINADNTTEFSVQLKDRNGNNVSGSITTSTSTLGGSISIASNTLTGVATITYTPGLVGTETIRIYVNGVLIDTRTIVVTHGILASVVLTPADSVVLVLQATDATLTATLRDQRGNLITTPSSISFSTNDSGTTLTIKSSQTITSNGVATIVLTSSPTVEGVVIVTASATTSGINVSGSTTITAQNFGFSKTAYNLVLGDTLSLEALGGTTATTWTLTNGSLSTTTGTSSILTTTGNTTVTISDTSLNNAVAMTMISVYTQVTTSITTDIALINGGTSLTLEVNNGDGSYNYTSSSASIISVDSNGVLTANASSGTATITVDDGLIYDGQRTTNTATTADIYSFDQLSASVDTIYLDTANNTTATFGSISGGRDANSYSSNNTNVASVNTDGTVITAIVTGNAVIVIRDNVFANVFTMRSVVVSAPLAFTGTALPSTLASGNSTSFNIAGGGDNITVTADNNGTIVKNGSVYTFTAPTTGAFAGDYNIVITDTDSGFSTTQTVSVPPRLTLISNQGNANLLGVSGSAIVEISGLTTLDTVFTTSLNSSSLTIGSVINNGVTTQTVVLTNPDNVSTEFTISAKATNHATVTVTGRILKSITYSGTVFSNANASNNGSDGITTGMIISIVGQDSIQYSNSSNGTFTLTPVARLANNAFHRLNVRATGHVQQPAFRASSSTVEVTLVQITNPASISIISLSPSTATVFAIRVGDSENTRLNFNNNLLQVSVISDGASYTVFAQADGYFNSTTEVFVSSINNNATRSITLTALPPVAEATVTVVATVADEVGGSQQVASDTLGRDAGFSLVFNTTAQSTSTEIAQDRIVEEIMLELPAQALDFVDANVESVSVTSIAVQIVPIDSSNTITTESQLTGGVSYQVDIVATTDATTVLIDRLTRPLRITIGYDTGLVSQAQLLSGGYVVIHRANNGDARADIAITVDNINEAQGLITFEVSELSIFSIGLGGSSGEITVASGGGCVLNNDNNQGIDLMFYILLVLALLGLLRKKLISFVLLASLLIAPNLQAVETYLGVGVGASRIEPIVTGDFSVSHDSDTAWKILAGQHVNDYFSLEASYANLGKAMVTGSDGNISIDYRQLTFGGVYRLPNEHKIIPFVGAGFRYSDVDVGSSDFTITVTNSDNTDNYWIFGVDIPIKNQKYSTRVSYTKYSDDASLYSVGFVVPYSF